MKQTLYICPNNEKTNILNKLSKDNKLHNIKFMSKQEFINNYYFTYNEKTIYYLLKKYNYNIDVIKVYLNYLYIIDINKIYKSKKLNFLKDLKQELLDNNLLIENTNFKKYISNKEIKVLNYYDLEKYEEELFNYKLSLNDISYTTDIHKFNTLEEEVNNLCIEIIKLLNKGIDINKIFIYADKEYNYTLNRLFNYYKIPINTNEKYSIYGTKQVKDYLNTNKLILENNDITRKIISIEESLLDIEKDKYYKEILIDKLKDTYIKKNKLKNAVNIIDIYKRSINDDEYLFILGFNNDIIPKNYKDIDYISDKEKEEVSLYTSTYKNNRNKKTLINILSNIKNLYISYKLTSNFNNYYPSPLIEEYNFNIITNHEDNYNYSNFYNELRLGIKLDNFYQYNEKKDYLKELYSHYKTNYNDYTNNVDSINIDKKNNYKLSYTSLNTYNECAFKYYLKYILKIDKYEDTFQAFIGSLYHEILSHMFNTDFDFEKEYNNYLKNRNLSPEEKILLIKIKKNLEELLIKEKEYLLATGYNNSYYENKFSIEKDSNIFEGYIDRIMYNDNNYAILDYKTGNPDTDIKLTKYGLNMQLPSYLYLVNKSKLFNNPKFGGIYYQKILFDKPTWSLKENDITKINNDRLKYIGYSTDDIERLSKFDPSYEKSNIIKSLSYNDKFGAYSKILTDKQVDRLINYTENEVEKCFDNLKENNYTINPKSYNKENISCKFCNFKDICFMNTNNIKYLSKVEDLDFLEEGEDK